MVVEVVFEVVVEVVLVVVGVWFWLYGCDVEYGLDCVGLVVVVLWGGGFVGVVLCGYVLCGGDFGVVVGVLDVVLVWVECVVLGDVVLMVMGLG